MAKYKEKMKKKKKAKRVEQKKKLAKQVEKDNGLICDNGVFYTAKNPEQNKELNAGYYHANCFNYSTGNFSSDIDKLVTQFINDHNKITNNIKITDDTMLTAYNQIKKKLYSHRIKLNSNLNGERIYNVANILTMYACLPALMKEVNKENEYVDIEKLKNKLMQSNHQYNEMLVTTYLIAESLFTTKKTKKNYLLYKNMGAFINVYPVLDFLCRNYADCAKIREAYIKEANVLKGNYQRNLGVPDDFDIEEYFKNLKTKDNQFAKTKYVQKFNFNLNKDLVDDLIKTPKEKIATFTDKKGINEKNYYIGEYNGQKVLFEEVLYMEDAKTKNGDYFCPSASHSLYVILQGKEDGACMLSRHDYAYAHFGHPNKLIFKDDGEKFKPYINQLPIMYDSHKHIYNPVQATLTPITCTSPDAEQIGKRNLHLEKNTAKDHTSKSVYVMDKHSLKQYFKDCYELHTSPNVIDLNHIDNVEDYYEDEEDDWNNFEEYEENENEIIEENGDEYERTC